MKQTRDRSLQLMPTRRATLSLMMSALVAAGVCGGSLALSGTAHAQAAQPTVKVGAVLSITGPGSGLGVAERNGILLAQKQINAAGGIGGRKLEMIIEDDGSKADIAKNKAEALVFESKVVALVGGSLTASTGSIASITDAEKLPQFAITGLGPQIELSYKQLFHLQPPQSLNAKAMLEYSTKVLKVKKIGVLHDSGYGQLVMAQLKELGPSYGTEFVSVEKFEVGATDATTQAAKVRASNPEAVFIIATSATPFRNARQVKITQPIVAPIGSSAREYINGMGEFADDIVFPVFLVGEAPAPHQKQFVDMYKAEYQSLPQSYEAAGYDAVNMIAAALKKLGPDAPREALVKELRQPYQGVFAKVNFGKDDMTGIDLSSYVYAKFTKGQVSVLPFKANGGNN